MYMTSEDDSKVTQHISIVVLTLQVNVVILTIY